MGAGERSLRIPWADRVVAGVIAGIEHCADAKPRAQIKIIKETERHHSLPLCMPPSHRTSFHIIIIIIIIIIINNIKNNNKLTN